jgi:hypothetical protein
LLFSSDGDPRQDGLPGSAVAVFTRSLR